jgi:hypothetical protein
MKKRTLFLIVISLAAIIFWHAGKRFDVPINPVI